MRWETGVPGAEESDENRAGRARVGRLNQDSVEMPPEGRGVS